MKCQCLLAFLFCFVPLAIGETPTTLPGPATTTAATVGTVTLEIGKKQLVISFSQDGKDVPIIDGVINLKPKPFDLHFNGNQDDGSFLVTTDAKALDALPGHEKVLITGTTGGAWNG